MGRLKVEVISFTIYKKINRRISREFMSGYKKMFERLEPFYPRRDDLDKLALIMSGKTRFPDGGDQPALMKAKTTATVPTIPAGYTYLGQFMTHDISFDQRSDRHRREDFPSDVIDQKCLSELRNLRQPFFDLEAVYGHTETTNPGEIHRSELMLPPSFSQPFPFLRLGITEEGERFPNDLPRGSASAEAKIADLRNDENLLIAQTQVAFMKFHNALVMEFGKDIVFRPDKTREAQAEQLFEKARRAAIRYYQTIILTDYLPRIVQESVLLEAIEKVKTKEPAPDDFMPLEFSVAAFRFGHSMIRETYDLNKNRPLTPLDNLVVFTGRGEMGSKHAPRRAFHLNLPSSWIINWNLFFEINNVPPKNIAEMIDTQLPPVLLKLRPKAFHTNGGRASSLAALDLYRGRKFGLPTGQDVALAMGLEPLPAKRIADLINSKTIDDVPGEKIPAIKKRLCAVFSETTPLWFYILAEAEIQPEDEIAAGAPFKNAGKLGAVGSRIVAETIINFLYWSEYSILRNADWEKGEDFLLEKDRFDMPSMLKFVQKTCEEHYKRLYPIKYYPVMKGKFDELDPLEKGYQTEIS